MFLIQPSPKNNFRHLAKTLPPQPCQHIVMILPSKHKLSSRAQLIFCAVHSQHAASFISQALPSFRTDCIRKTSGHSLETFRGLPFTVPPTSFPFPVSGQLMPYRKIIRRVLSTIQKHKCSVCVCAKRRIVES